MNLSRFFTFCLLSVAFSVFAGCAAPEPVKPRILWPPPPNQSRLEFIGIYQSQDDFGRSSAGAWMQKITGDKAPLAFKSPIDVVADSKGTVYVSDIHRTNVVVFDFTARHVELFAKGPVFSQPLGMAVDSADRLYVADGGSGTVKVFAPDRSPLFAFGGPEVFEKPAYITIDDALSRIYVSDVKAGEIDVFDMQGNLLFSFGKNIEGERSLHGPQGIAVSREGEIFVADMLNARIAVFDAEGNFLRAFGERGDRIWQFENPKDLAFDSDNNLHLVDNRRGYLLTYSTAGELLLATGAGGRTADPLGFANPAGIAVDRKDRIYITDHLNRRFAVWQYLSEEYLQEHPITQEQEEAVRKAIEEGEKEGEKEQ